MPSKKVTKNACNLDKCTVKTYGKGFLLVPSKDNKDWETKYYHNGWWMKKHNAWFFKKEYENFLIDNGAKMSEENQKLQKKTVSKEMKIQEYGKGYLLVPNQGNPDWGTKYYHNGWWLSKHNAWFFKKEHKDYLFNNFSQQKMVKSNKKENIVKDIKKSVVLKSNTNTSFKKYGKGYLLVPEKGHPDWGTKYYHNGWWMPKHNAWFFKKQDKEAFNSVCSFKNTSKERKTINKNVKQKSKKTNNGLSVKTHGKGFLLIPEEGHPDWGIKYYNNGWWMPKHNAWFFKSEYKDYLMSYKSYNNQVSLFENFKLQKYGKGYLLVPEKNHQDWGEKYYYNGWWFSKLNGWFFKKEWKQFLIENGAELVKNLL